MVHLSAELFPSCSWTEQLVQRLKTDLMEVIRSIVYKPNCSFFGENHSSVILQSFLQRPLQYRHTRDASQSFPAYIIKNKLEDELAKKVV